MERPLLRNLEISPYTGPMMDASGEVIPPESGEEGKMTFVLRDPESFAPDLAIPTEMAVLLTLFDGLHTHTEIVRNFHELTGIKIDETELAEIVKHFDSLNFLESPGFAAFLKEEMDSFAALETRPAMMAGGAYEKEPAMLRMQLQNVLEVPGKIRAAEGEGTVIKRVKPVRGMIVPHVDPYRGAAAYGWAYETLRDHCDAELFIILGTAHNPMKQPWALTRKHFETPLGTVRVDTDFVNRLDAKFQEKYAAAFPDEAARAERPVNLFADEFVHRDEHSVEFQTVFLQHTLVKGAGRAVRIVPILVQSFSRFLDAPDLAVRENPALAPEVAAMTEALAELIREEEARTGKKVGIIAAADFSHAGPLYGSEDPVDAAAQDTLRDEDTRLFTHILDGDALGFWLEILRHQDKNSVCGTAPVFCFMEVMQQLGENLAATGQLLCYEQAVDEETRSCVTFATLVF